VNFTRFNKAKCKVLHLCWGNPRYQYRLGDERIESSPEEKDLGVLVDEKLVMSHQCALDAAQNMAGLLGCIPSSVGTKSREGNLPLCSTLVRPTPGVLCPALEPPAQEGHRPVGAEAEEATKVTEGLEHFC